MIGIDALLRELIRSACHERIKEETIEALWQRIQAELDRWRASGPDQQVPGG